MKETILNMQKSLKDDCFVAFVSANDEYHFGVRKKDKLSFLEDNRMLISRENGNQTIINLDLIIGVCIRQEWM